jgi:SAM-dependent methyltransferase
VDHHTRRFEGLTYDRFRELALDESLSSHEKIGFPNSYRDGAEAAILADIAAKLPALGVDGCRFLDIGPGCSGLPRMLLELCQERGHEAVLIDSREMLSQLPDGPRVTKLPGRFPEAMPASGLRSFDAILAYSVLHYVFAEGDVDGFLDSAIALLAPGGRLLLGDIPNVSRRARFLRSEAGRKFHVDFTGRDEPPPSELTDPPAGGLDDEVVLALVARARAAGCDAYVMPLAPELPLANRREDIVVARP